MPSRPEGLARYADRLVLAACVGASLWFLALDETARVSRATSVAHAITTPVEWAADALERTAGLRRENEQLRAELAALALDAVQLRNERERIEELREQAGFFQRSRGRLVPATVLELTVSRFPLQAKIRPVPGATDTLAALQPVVTARGLAGRVREVLPGGEALVQLLTDPESRISIESRSTGVTGLLRYDGVNFVMDHVPRGEPIAEGDTLVTSGLGGTVPRGLPVGVVRELRAPATELFQYVEVEPAVRFSALDRVYVVTRPGPWYLRASSFADRPAPPDSSAAGDGAGGMP